MADFKNQLMEFIMNWRLTIIAGTATILLSGNTFAVKPLDKELPFYGEFSGHLIGFNNDIDAITARCSPPVGQVAWAIASFEGWGDVTHLGWTHVYAEHCSYRPEFGPPVGEYGEGTLRLTADNGDLLTGTYTDGTTNPQFDPIFYFMDYFTFDNGGDGRFNIALGEGVELGSLDVSSGAFTLEMTGVISYSKK